MDPAVQASWIAAVSGFIGVLVGVGGTVTIAIVASRNTRKATADTIAAGTAQISAQMEADRRNRIWEQQAAAYTDAIRSIKYWQKVNDGHLQGVTLRTRRDFEPAPVDMRELEARLVAYASSAVNDGFRRFSATREEFGSALLSYDIILTPIRPLGESEPTLLDHPGDARDAAVDALAEVDRLGEQLIGTIRAELQASTQAGAQPAGPADMS